MDFDGKSFEVINDYEPQLRTPGNINSKGLLKEIRQNYDYDIPSTTKVFYIGEYWLIISNEILKYIGTNIEKISGNDPSPYVCSDAEFNGDYWLIGFDAPNSMGYLGKFDGSAFAELNIPSGRHRIMDLEWNGDYWLIGTHNSDSLLIKYDGHEFIDLTKNVNKVIYGKNAPNFKRFRNPPGYS